MLNIFPDLLAFGLVAPVLLRVSLGVIFLNFGWRKLTNDREQKAALFETLGLRPGAQYARAVGIIELLAGICLIVGFLTQIAALVTLIISIGAYYLKGKQPNQIENSKRFFFLLFVISLSLLFSGAGFFAFDLPL